MQEVFATLSKLLYYPPTFNNFFPFKMFKRIFFLLLLGVVYASAAHAAFYDPGQDVYTLKTGHFYIHYPAEVAPVAEDLKNLVEPVHDRLAQKFKWTPWGRTHIVLVDKTDTANGLATVLPANYMLLYVTPPDADSSLDHYHNYLELLFTHEYTHILHIDQHNRVADPFHWVFGKIVAPNGLTPGWMREGMAAWAETVETGRGRGNSSFSDMMLRTSVYANNFPAIDEVAGLSIKWPASESQYIYGVKFIQWLGNTFGEKTIQEYMEVYASGLWLFSLNNKAKRVFGKSFYQLWKEWQTELTVQYDSLKIKLEAQGLTPFRPFVADKDTYAYPLPHPSGDGYAYVRSSVDDASTIRIVFKEQKEPIDINRKANGQLAFSRDGGRYLAFSSISGVERYKAFADVFVYDTKKKNLQRMVAKDLVAKSMRGSDPDFSPADGGNRWMVMVRTNLGTDNLYVFDTDNRVGYFITDAPQYTQFSNPRFSPDGKRIVVSRRDHNGNRDIVLYADTGQIISNITRDAATDNHPVWSPSGGSVYYESDKSGVSNIYRHNFATGHNVRITNVLTGVFQPQIAPGGHELYVRYYTDKGFKIYRVDLDRTASLDDDLAMPLVVQMASADTNGKVAGYPSFGNTNLYQESISVGEPFGGFGFAGSTANASSDQEKPKKANVQKKTVPVTAYQRQLGKLQKYPNQPVANLTGAKKYRAFPQVLVPRQITPTFVTLDDAFLFGLSTGRYDPLYRHSWNAGVSYRTDAAFLGASASYAYVRYNPSLFVGFARYAVNWGDLFNINEDFYEQRLQGYVGASYSMGHHQLSGSYFFENRDNLSAIPAGFILPNLDNYAGLRFIYTYSRLKEYPNSISRESGPFVKIGFDLTDSILGSAEVNEQEVVTGDIRYYFEMPWSDHHVFALRTAGGWAWGDQELGGSFRFGGPFGEGTLAGHSSRLFPFRGLPGVTFVADRVLLFSGEYRFPLATIERGIGTWPIYLQKVHTTFFSDFGDSWARNGKDNVGFFDDFFLSAGAELQGDFVVGYGLPVTTRLGYAIILKNRDQIAGLTDSLFGNDIRNGTFYIQFGTSF